MKLRIILYAILIVLNLISLYFIIAFFCYDEMADSISNRGKAYLFFISCLFNLYFLALIIIENTFSDKYDFRK